MRTTLIALILAATACGGTPSDPPQNAHEPATALEGLIQCESQLGVPEPPSEIAHWADGAPVANYYTPEQCLTFCRKVDAGDCSQF